MTPKTILLTNAKYYSDGAFCDGNILLADGKVLSVDAGSCDAQIQIDAAGLLLLPGLIDTHVHFREPGRSDKEDFASGSRAAAAGGVTMFLDMPNVTPPTATPELLRQRIALAEAKSLVDFNFYAAAGSDNCDEFAALAAMGVVGFKTFLHSAPVGGEGEYKGLYAATDADLLTMLKAGKKTGKRFFFHCEDEALIKQNEQTLRQNGVTDNSFHYKARTATGELLSIRRIIGLAEATGAKVGICHVSTPDGAQLIKQAKTRGVDIVAETGSHFLFFSTDDIDRWGAYAKCNPSLRSAVERDALWDYLKDGTIDMIGSDHAPATAAEKSLAKQGGIWQAPSGIAGIEAALPLLLTAAHQGRLTYERLAQLMSENAAKIFGFYPAKGRIAPGADADLILIDPQAEYLLDSSLMYTKARDNNKLFDGLPVTGKLKYTIAHGRIIVADGALTDDAVPQGRFIAAADGSKAR